MRSFYCVASFALSIYLANLSEFAGSFCFRTLGQFSLFCMFGKFVFLRCSSGVLSTLLLAFSGGISLTSFAQSLPVTNGSFEGPTVPAGFPAYPLVTGWQKAPPLPPEFGISAEDWNNLAGVFPNSPVGNPRHISNLDGNQVAFVFPVPGMSLSQETSSTFTPGISYNLQVAIRGGGALTAGTQFRVGLYYTLNGNRISLASTPVSATSAFATTQELIQVSTGLATVKSTDAWSGRAIGIELAPLSQNGTAGIAYWELDNVRLSAVPEPSTVAMAAVGALALVGLLCQRRSR